MALDVDILRARHVATREWIDKGGRGADSISASASGFAASGRKGGPAEVSGAGVRAVIKRRLGVKRIGRRWFWVRRCRHRV